jgi:hypothetical protein
MTERLALQLMHPILDSLDHSPHEWLKNLLFTFNEGNIGKFEALGPLLPREVSEMTSRSSSARFFRHVFRGVRFSPSCKRTIPSYGKRSV